MSETLDIPEVYMDEIVHLDRLGNELLKKPLEVSSTFRIFSNNHDYPELTTQLEEVKEKFVLLTRVFPLRTNPEEKFYQQGVSDAPGCFKMTRDVFKAVQELILKYRDACELLHKRLAQWLIEVPDLVSRSQEFLKRMEKHHHDFQHLYSVCKQDIKHEGFFLARTKFHTSMARHGELLDELYFNRDAVAVLQARIQRVSYLVHHADRLSGFLTLIHLYLVAITAKDDIKCAIEKVYDTGHLCGAHPHNKIKREYHGLVAELNTPPNVSAFLQSSTGFLRDLGEVEKQCKYAHGLLQADYVSSLFRVQKWINGYIEKRENALTGEYLLD